MSPAEELAVIKSAKRARGRAGSPMPMRSPSLAFGRHPNDQGSIHSPRRLWDGHGMTGTQLFGSIALAEYLQQDERAVLVVDITDEANSYTDGLHLLFSNAALKLRSGLLDRLQGKSVDAGMMHDQGTSFADFKRWVMLLHSDPSLEPCFPFAGITWQASLVRKRLRIITGQSDQLPLLDHDNRRPAMFSYGPSFSAQSTSPANELASPGYFDFHPVHPQSKSSTPGNLQATKTQPVPDDVPSSHVENVATAQGDMGLSALLSGPVSPSFEQEQTTYTYRASAEDLPDNMTGVHPGKGFFDWTRLPMSPSLPSHIQYARSIDWAATSLGPMEQWSEDLRGMCNLIMASPHPAAMYWGPEHVAIYNEAYIPLAGMKHPALMGSRYQDIWAEIWHAIEEVFTSAMSGAQATMKDDDCLFMLRNGFVEETYFSWSIIPLIGGDGSVVGLYNPAFEKTRRKIAERRMLTLREVGERTSAAREVSQFWGLLLEGLEYNEYDAPLVMVYSLCEDIADSDGTSSNSSLATTVAKQACLEGALGVSVHHPAAPAQIDLRTGTNGFGAAFRQAITTNRPVVLREDDGTLDIRLLDGIQWRGFGDASKVVVVSPIHPTTGESTLGFLVMGTNPRRPYDDDYDLFVQLLGRQLATSVASVVLFEEEIRKGEMAAHRAAQDRIELSNQLAARTQEAVESENKFTRMAELAPVGMYIGDKTGKIVFTNDAWYDISSYPRGEPVNNNWINHVVDEDRAHAWGAWMTMLEEKCPISLEFRFKKPWKNKVGNVGQTWVIASASPEKDEHGNVTRVFGSVTDISSQKYAESLQRRRMEEAVELKRQQERYIDTTSHEMRNPLSAILQSAEAIVASLSELRLSKGLTGLQLEIADSSMDSAQTITLCAQHQKRIVDDVLTLSKLDSAMLQVTPVDVQPVVVIHRALAMFKSELQAADIGLDIRIDPSYNNLQIDWVRLDPHRLSQVLINLTTNAIKFTTTQEKRTICMHIAASRSRPSLEDKWNLTYIPSHGSDIRDITAADEWGTGEPVYIHFAVQDTGRGLNDVEKKQLFQRFSQANPRTHITYGGSGLGLFISRELVELQGGEIGVASEAGKGSTFAFYVKARRSLAPIANAQDDQHHTSQFQVGFHQAVIGRMGSKPAAGPNHISALPLSAASTGSDNPASLQVLIVEDNLINQKVLSVQLQKRGCKVYVANHGGEAIDHIKRSKFAREHAGDAIDIDVVLMDLEMPVMDGQTCARKLREMQRSGELVGHIPIIAVTANVREEQIKKTLASGIDDVVSKPFRIPDLIPKMHAVIQKVRGQLGPSEEEMT